MRPLWIGVLGMLMGMPVVAEAQARATARDTAREAATAKEHDSLGADLSKTNEDGQPLRLPELPAGMNLDLVRAGDDLFHGKGHCSACHGADGEGMPNSGSAITVALNFVPEDWRVIDSLIIAGIPDPITRSAISMPPRGGKSDLTDAETRAVAAYVWAISRVRDEPWPGGHRSHASAEPGTK
jgi:mono/diheme cytochrome c family protein